MIFRYQRLFHAVELRSVLALIVMRVESKMGEVTVLFFLGGNVRAASCATKFAIPFLRPEEEQLVLHDRTAEGVSKIVTAQFVFADVIQVICNFLVVT